MKKLLLTLILFTSEYNLIAKEGMAQKALRPEQMAQFELARQFSEVEIAVTLMIDNQTDKNLTLSILRDISETEELDTIAPSSKSKKIFIPFWGTSGGEIIFVSDEEGSTVATII